MAPNFECFCGCSNIYIRDPQKKSLLSQRNNLQKLGLCHECGTLRPAAFLHSVSLSARLSEAGGTGEDRTLEA